jgi:hypothetical protein
LLLATSRSPRSAVDPMAGLAAITAEVRASAVLPGGPQVYVGGQVGQGALA